MLLRWQRRCHQNCRVRDGACPCLPVILEVNHCSQCSCDRAAFDWLVRQLEAKAAVVQSALAMGDVVTLALALLPAVLLLTMGMGMVVARRSKDKTE